MRKHLIFSLLSALTITATAQKTTAPQFTSVTLDGVVRPQAVVLINGRLYVAVDALKQAGVTVVRPTVLGLYNFASATKLPVKLKGCRNEWLTDGINRVRFEAMNTNQGKWTVHFQFQSTKQDALLQNFLQQNKIITVLKNGVVLDPSKNPFEVTEIGSSYTDPGETTRATFVLAGADLADSNPPVKIMVRPIAKSAVQGTWTFDLSCQK